MHKKLSMRAALLGSVMTLAGCGSPMLGTANGTLTTSGKPAACLSLEHVAPNRGKPGGVTTEDIAAALDRDNPVARVRNLVGDTAPTIRSVDKNNAALAALCEGSEGGGQ